MLIAVVVGAITSWMSVRRYKAKENFHPSRLANKREKYFETIAQKSTDKPVEKIKPAEPVVVSTKSEKYFSVTSIRRETKIEDDDVVEDAYFEEKVPQDNRASMDTHNNRGSRPQSRAPSVRSRSSTTNLPYGARRHRASWSAHDFHAAGADIPAVPSGLQSRMSVDSVRDVPNSKRPVSVRRSLHENPSLSDVANAATESPAYKARHDRGRSTSQAHTHPTGVPEEAEDKPTSQHGQAI